MSTALRVLHLGNGAASKIHAILRGLERRGHEIHMVPIPPAPPALGGVRVRWHDRGPADGGRIAVLRRMWEVRALVKRVQPDIVHAHNAWGPGWYGAAAGRHPFVIHAYGGDVLPEQYGGRPAYQRYMTAWTLQAADRVIVTGRHMTAAAHRLGVPPEKVVVLPRGVDLERFRPGLDVAALRDELGLSGARPIILSPRYQADEPLYNLDVVVEAFERVRRRFPSAACLQMYGRQHETGAKRLKAAAEEHGLGDSYRLIPAVEAEKMALFYNLADVAVSVPSSDGFPVTVLEASACECPIVVAELPYCDEWFSNRQNGFVVPQRDAAALAETIVELASDEALRARIGAAGRARVARSADYERCMDQLEEMYRMLLRKRAPKGAESCAG